MPDDPVTIEELRDHATQLRALCARIEPALLGDEIMAEAFDLAVEMEKLLAGTVVRLTARWEQTGAWKRDGGRSPEEAAARRTGRTRRAARRDAETSRRLAEQSALDRALREGAVSPEQADQVSSATAADPTAETDLLDTARRQPLHELRRRAGEVRARAERDQQARHRRQHAARCVRRWVDDDGMYNLALRTTPERGADIDATLKPLVDRAFADARDAGRFEPVEAYTADVVTDLLTIPAAAFGPRSAGNQAVRPERKVIALVDAAALRRGHAEAGETCEIAGVGRVTVTAVRSLMSDAFLALVVKDGVDVLHVTHLGRKVTAHQRTALEARGAVCEVIGCGSTRHLEIDHVTGWSLTGHTRLDDLAWLCTHHHRRKTQEGLALVGPPRERQLVGTAEVAASAIPP